MADYETKPLWDVPQEQQPQVTMQPRLLEDPLDGSPHEVTQFWYGLAESAIDGGLYSVDRFMDAIKSDHIHSYGTTVHAIAAAMMAAGNVMVRRLGASDEQRDYAMRELMTRWFQWSPTAPIKIMRYEKLLDPANAAQFDNDMTQDIWEWLRREAHRRLINSQFRSVAEREHLERVVTGEIPFGLKLRRGI